MEWIVGFGDLPLAAKKFWQEVKDDKVFAFYGQMGAGKTTFIHALCDEKRVAGPVSSPTFSIINEYQFPEGKIYHIDLYRLKDEEEVLRAGVEECIYSGDICMVEWPEKAGEIFPENTVAVHLDVIDTLTRKITIKSVGEMVSDSI